MPAPTVGQHTLRETRNSANAWEGVFPRIDNQAAALQQLWDAAEEIVVSGCGSGLNIAHAVAPFCQRLSGKTCRAVHASDLMLNRDAFLNPSRRTLAITFSRSGSTSESVRAQQAAAEAGAATLAVTCFADSPMARAADIVLVLEEAHEESITTTQSLTAMVLTGYYLAAVCTGRQDIIDGLQSLPALARDKMAAFETIGRELSEDAAISKYAFLGSGPNYGLAREAQLKIKETVLLPVDSYVTLDYQHGPVSNVDEAMLVTVLMSDTGQAHYPEFVRNIRTLKGKVLLVCDRATDELRAAANYVIELDTGLPDGSRDILYMPALQFLACYKSIAVGHDPDNPHNLHYFVELEAD
ncbi:MAG: SIS domain-containing protein [Lentisphaeria bacterium]|jgi:glucosamine--fructose-6-phosphate aminotransferase (isomerizing)|nr:SIS domain-containing protein [Lentisphaeria bacterium]MDP7743157.1 SIS domain-containing protein [Lentisphaeria bacterium]